MASAKTDILAVCFVVLKQAPPSWAAVGCGYRASSGLGTILLGSLRSCHFRGTLFYSVVKATFYVFLHALHLNHEKFSTILESEMMERRVHKRSWKCWWKITIIQFHFPCSFWSTLKSSDLMFISVSMLIMMSKWNF